MSAPFRTFTGFKGKMAAAEIDGIPFVLLAKNQRQLEILWAGIMREVQLDPGGIKSAILIEAATLPDGKAAVPMHHDHLDRLNADLARTVAPAPTIDI